MAEKRYTVRYVAVGGDIVRQEFDAITGKARTAYQEIAQGSKSAERSAAVFEQQMRDQKRALDSLQASLDPTFAATKRYESATEDLAQAQRAGLITQQEQLRLLKLAEQEYQDSMVAVRRFGGAFDFRMATMQLSQVSDMAIATGDPLRALAVQASDLGMLFGGPLAIGLGVAAGGALMLGTSLLKARDGAEDTEASFETLTGSVSDYMSMVEFANQSMADLRAEFGALAQEVQTAALQAAQNRIADIRDELQDTATVVGTVADDISDALDQILDIEQAKLVGDPTSSQLADFNDAIALLNEQVDDSAAKLEISAMQVQALDAAFDDLRGAETMEDIEAAAGGVLDAMQAIVPEGRALPAPLREAYAQMEELRRAAIRALRAEEGLNQSAESLPPPINRAAGAASGLASNLGMAAGMARQLIANLGMVPSALASAAQQTEAAIGSLREQNAALNYQINEGLNSQAAAIKAARDAAINQAEIRGATLEDMQRITERFNERIEQVDALETTNAALNETLREQTKAATGGGGGGGGGAAGAADELSESLQNVEDAAKAAGEALAQAVKEADEMRDNWRKLASDWTSTFVDAAGSGDLRSVFSSLGNDARDSFFSALGSGQSIGQIFSSGISGTAAGISGLMGGGGMASLGMAISSAMPVIGTVLAGIDLIKGFSSSEVVGQGITGSIGPGAWANTFERTKRSSWWGLRTSTSTDYDYAAGPTRALREAGATVRTEIRDIAEGIGGSARDLRRVRQQFRIDTEGMDAEQVQRALASEVEAYRESVAQAALGTRRFSQEGESAVETLARLSGSLAGFNEVMASIGADGISASVRGAGRASRIMSEIGGADAFSSNVNTFFSEFLTPEQQLANISRQFREQARSIGRIPINVNTTEELRAKVLEARDAGNLRGVARLTALAPRVAEMERLRDAIEATAESAREARRQEEQLAQQRREQIRLDQARQRVEILRLQDRETDARQLELSLMDEHLRAGQKQIWRLQDQIAAQEEAARAAEAAAQQLERLRDALNPEMFGSQIEYFVARARIAPRMTTETFTGSSGGQAGAPSGAGGFEGRSRDEIVDLLLNIEENTSITAQKVARAANVGWGVRA